MDSSCRHPYKGNRIECCLELLLGFLSSKEMGRDGVNEDSRLRRKENSKIFPGGLRRDLWGRLK